MESDGSTFGDRRVRVDGNISDGNIGDEDLLFVRPMVLRSQGSTGRSMVADGQRVYEDVDEDVQLRRRDKVQHSTKRSKCIETDDNLEENLDDVETGVEKCCTVIQSATSNNGREVSDHIACSSKNGGQLQGRESSCHNSKSGDFINLDTNKGASVDTEMSVVNHVDVGIHPGQRQPRKPAPDAGRAVRQYRGDRIDIVAEASSDNPVEVGVYHGHRQQSLPALRAGQAVREYHGDPTSVAQEGSDYYYYYFFLPLGTQSPRG